MIDFERRCLSIAVLALAWLSAAEISWARHSTHHATAPSRSSSHTSSRHATSRHNRESRATPSRRGVSSARVHHHEVAKHETHPTHTRYAYSIDLFLTKSPNFETSPLPEGTASTIRSAFFRGTAGAYSPRTLVRAGVVSYHQLRGGIFWRRQPIKYIIMHSTETGIPQGAVRVIESWNSLGRRHPGAQYVIDRDGTIYQSLDPDMASVHVNIFKTLPGINNDDTVGIEMCHAGKQDYPPAQVDSAVHLVVYLQNHYHVADENVVTHRYAQQGDHTDPVLFDWAGFIASKAALNQSAIASRMDDINHEAVSWTFDHSLPTDNLLQIHKHLGKSDTTPPLEVTVPVNVPTASEPEALTPTKSLTPTTSPSTSPTTRSTPADLRGPIELSPGEANMLQDIEPNAETSKQGSPEPGK